MTGGRVKLKGWQQAAVAVGSAVGALLDPRRADLIAALGETTGKPAFERVLERMKRSPEGRVSISFIATWLLFFFLKSRDIYSQNFCIVSQMASFNVQSVHVWLVVLFLLLYQIV